jgi:acyl-CoA synthetase (NDP forming)
MAAASHTGSLAGADDVFDDIMRQCGVLRAESVQEAFNWVRFLATVPLPSGEDAVIVTNGGGIGVLATDACEKYGVRLYDNQPILANAFAEVMPEFGSSKNPVDLTGQATGEDYARALDAVFARADMHAAVACTARPPSSTRRSSLRSYGPCTGSTRVRSRSSLPCSEERGWKR